MIDAALEMVQQIGVVGAGGLSVLSLGLWLRRAQKVATYLRVAGVVAVLTGLGALAGVVNLGRLYDLGAAAYELLPLALGLARAVA